VGSGIEAAPTVVSASLVPNNGTISPGATPVAGFQRSPSGLTELTSTLLPCGYWTAIVVVPINWLE